MLLFPYPIFFFFVLYTAENAVIYEFSLQIAACHCVTQARSYLGRVNGFSSAQENELYQWWLPRQSGYIWFQESYWN